MPQRRIYVPLDDAALAMLAARREIGPAPVSAHAVTAGQERGLATDEELLEYAALLGAAAQADDVRPAGGRRVIAAADVEEALVEEVADEGAAPTAVEIDAPIPARRIVSFHLDELPGSTDDGDLLWYDVTELDEVLRLGTGAAGAG